MNDELKRMILEMKDPDLLVSLLLEDEAEEPVISPIKDGESLTDFIRRKYSLVCQDRARRGLNPKSAK